MPKELNEDTGFKVSIKTLVGIGAAMATVISMWFMLLADINAAKILGMTDDQMQEEVADRLGGINFETLEENVFRPYSVSNEIYNAFEQNAAKIGVANPFDKAADVIGDLEARMADLSLGLAEFPVFENPLQPIMQDTPLGPQTLNLPSIDANAVSAQVQGGGGGSFSKMTNAEKLRILFGDN